MAAPRKKPPPPPPPHWHRWTRWTESRAVLAAAALTLFSLFSFLFGTTRDLVLAGWHHYTGAELAHELDPKVEALLDAQLKQSAILEAQDGRLRVTERNLLELRKIKEAEQEQAVAEAAKLEAVLAWQRQACSEQKLSLEFCAGLPPEDAPPAK